jgi:hypothetical protein
MSSDGVAVIELVKVRRQRATILKLNAPSLDTTHSYELAIRSAKTDISAIGQKQEPVAWSHGNGLPLMD